MDRRRSRHLAAWLLIAGCGAPVPDALPEALPQVEAPQPATSQPVASAPDPAPKLAAETPPTTPAAQPRRPLEPAASWVVPSDAPFQLAGFRDGELQILRLAGEVVVAAGRALARVDEHGRLALIEYPLVGLEPGGPEGVWKVSALGGRWPDNTWLVAEAQYFRTTPVMEVYHREGNAWRRQLRPRCSAGVSTSSTSPRVTTTLHRRPRAASSPRPSRRTRRASSCSPPTPKRPPRRRSSRTTWRSAPWQAPPPASCSCSPPGASREHRWSSAGPSVRPRAPSIPSRPPHYVHTSPCAPPTSVEFRYVVLHSGPAREPERFLPGGNLYLESLDGRPAPAWRPGKPCDNELPAFVALRTLARDTPHNLPEPAFEALVRDHAATLEIVERLVEVYRRGRRTTGLIVRPTDQLAVDALLAALAAVAPGERRTLECRQPRIRRSFSKITGLPQEAPL